MSTFTWNGVQRTLEKQNWEGTPIASFLNEWNNSEDYVVGHTSGSTGTPKEIRLSKKAMKASARLTNQHFGLKEGDNILLCLSTEYIAGKMVIIRAIEGGLNLVVSETKSLPEWDGDLAFAAFVPLQIEALLHTSQETRDRLKKIGAIIIGGSPLSQSLQKELLELGVSNAYITYGMTETLSHVAVARIEKGKEPTYNALKGITFGTDNRECLTISAPHLQSEILTTNDVVELIGPTSFHWKGRWDNVINSGGVKIFPERVEKKISSLISERFYITGEPDDRLGSRVVLIIEGDEWDENRVRSLQERIGQVVMRYEKPKKIAFVKKFEETKTGKIKRRL